MRSVWFMAFNNIKKRIMQNIIICILLISTITLLIASLLIVVNSNGLYSRIAEQLNTSNIFVYTDTSYQNIDDANEYWENIDEVNFDILPYESIQGNITVNNEKIVGGFSFSVPNRNVETNQIIIVEGEKEVLDNGELWLSTGYAYLNEINVGDIITYKIRGEEVEYKVSGIFVDPPFCVPAEGINEVFVNEYEYEKLNVDENDDYKIRLNITEYEKADDYLIEWQNVVGKELNANVIREEEIIGQSSFQVDLSAIIMMITSSILVLVISIVIIYTVAADVCNDYKNIGILLACGYNVLKIRLIYCIQYIILYLIAVPIAGIAGYNMTYWILNEYLLRTMGLNGTKIDFFAVVLIVGIIVFLLILMTVYQSARGATKVDVIDILLGRTKFKSKNEKAREKESKKNSVLILMQSMRKVKIGQYMFIMVIAIGITFITMVVINVLRPMSDVDIFREYSGLANEDIYFFMNPYLEENAYDNIKKLLDEDSRIVTYYTGSQESIMMAEQDGIVRTNVVANILSEMVNDEKVPVSEGTNPKFNDEVVLSTSLMELYHKNVGDTILISSNGVEKKMNIVGTLLTSSNSGKVIALHESFIKEINSNYIPNKFTIEITDDDLEEDITEELLDIKTAMYVVSVNNVIYTISNAVKSGVSMAIIIINAVLWTVLMIIIFNVILINIIRERKVFGIMGVIGFSRQQERQVLIGPIVAASAFGILLGIVFVYYPGIPIMNQVYSSIGVRECPFSLGILEYGLFSIIYILFVIIASLIPTGKLSMVSSRELILEE